MPDDGRRYEVIDGTLVVTPAPSDGHQGVLGELFVRLHEACPSHLRVRLSLFDVTLAPDTRVQPDLLVAPKASLRERGLFEPPLLAIEILSPSTKSYDRGMKFARYAEAGVASYWIVDPAEPRLTAYDLVDGAYVEVADVVGEETWTAERPFPVTIRPAELLD
jgi:Uma2 family endonuclease